MVRTEAADQKRQCPGHSGRRGEWLRPGWQQQGQGALATYQVNFESIHMEFSDKCRIRHITVQDESPGLGLSTRRMELPLTEMWEEDQESEVGAPEAR